MTAAMSLVEQAIGCLLPAVPQTADPVGLLQHLLSTARPATIMLRFGRDHQISLAVSGVPLLHASLTPNAACRSV